MSSAEYDDEQPTIRINIPQRFLVLPGAAVLTGITIGLFRGSRTASLRFLAENAHRAPRTVRGWYLYNKSKNYRVALGGLKGAGAEAARLGLTAATWVGIEEGCARLGVDDAQEAVAGLGTATLFGVMYRLPAATFRRTVLLGVVIGGMLSGLRWSKGRLEEQLERHREEVEPGAGVEAGAGPAESLAAKGS
ncbi:uncharacterized protein BXZ73DRAFT_53066 [Epithele typhae]|uniref:uncharacterized protein n=1 Tax=Epithele typhae TaxID=378194 RepID=UPI0020073349|nr:uncharacterized protein BXZ73DRAFT_53066 [Epithele typhae]KAH9918232.1 hypothetical protein BXZ73DRAFT_53066 [Epithele typhae]